MTEDKVRCGRKSRRNFPRIFSSTEGADGKADNPATNGCKTPNPFQEGMRAGWPICLGYMPLGIAFGVLAQKAGLHPLEILLMSLVVFAGSSQFIVVSMLAGGAGIFSMIATTFTVNLRHLLMSSVLSVHLGTLNKGLVPLFAYGVTDESFAVNLSKFSEGDWSWQRALFVNHIANATWLISTVLGGYGGQFIPVGAFGIDYALTAMFLCLLVFQLKGTIYIFTGLIAGILSIVMALHIPGNAYIVLASVAAATIGVLIRHAHEDTSE
ncbi:MAG: AzlC family ABC transporter permease [Thermodesulfobacteriota bacterium]|nr:AzlC family ABC transporter permease [Thermodesulfobacteriota bacterium]